MKTLCEKGVLIVGVKGTFILDAIVPTMKLQSYMPYSTEADFFFFNILYESR